MHPALRLLPAAAAALVATGTALAACAADPDSSEPLGATLSRQYGCAACHGATGEGLTGPGWTGLYGSQVTLNDGTTVTADEAYIRRAIVDPDAEIPEGTKIPMPVNPAVTAEDLEVLVAYIISGAG